MAITRAFGLSIDLRTGATRQWETLGEGKMDQSNNRPEPNEVPQQWPEDIADWPQTASTVQGGIAKPEQEKGEDHV